MKYIPQAEPFVMIDDILSTNDLETTTVFLIQKGHLFVENNQFTEPGLVENMAQTAAAGTGFKASLTKEEPPVGFIGQVKNLEIYRLPLCGETITTTIKTVNQVMNAFIVNGEIRCGEEKIAVAEFKIFLQ